MSDLQGELKDKVLNPEREINNAIDYKVKRGPGAPPTWVMKGKLTNYKRLVEDGYSMEIAAEKSGASTHSLRRWAKRIGFAMPNFKKGGSRPKGSKVSAAPETRTVKAVHTYEPSFRKVTAEKAMAMLKAGEVVNLSEAGAKLGVNGTTLNGWCVQLGLIEPRRRTKSRKPANGALPIDVAVRVFEELFPEKPQSRLKFENALLRAMLEGKA